MNPEDIRTLTELKDFYARGGKASLLFFWGHTPKQADQIDKSCLSNWFPACFEADQQVYLASEHYLMAHKALLFGDTAIAQQICQARTPAMAKQLGRQVKGFDQVLWLEHSWNLNLQANLLKFSQNPELATFLISTGSCVLVEASPEDQIWGIGLSANDSRAHAPQHWLGTNLLGFALMEVRQRLISGGE